MSLSLDDRRSADVARCFYGGDYPVRCKWRSRKVRSRLAGMLLPRSVEDAMSTGVWTVDLLKEAERTCRRLKYVFFWGHTSRSGSRIGPHVLSQWHEHTFELMALMDWAADLAGRPAPNNEQARRHAELCMRMVGNSFQHLHESDHDGADEQQLVDDLLALISRALRLDE